MESEFQLQTLPPFSGGAASSTAEMSADEAFINGVYAGISFNSLLNQEQTPPPPPLLFLSPSLNYDPYRSYISDTLTNGFFFHGIPATETQNLKTPKTEEQLFDINSSVTGEVPQYNFFSQLPDLLSLELPQYNTSTTALQHFQLATESSSSPIKPMATGIDLVRRSHHQHRFGPYRSPGTVAPSSTLARQRRQRISDKTKCLQKLLPWDKRMDMATMLEETYKYIKFLQAQVSVLQSMPSNGAAAAASPPINDENGGVYGGALGRLNRQQLLEVVVNSPVAQTVLYSKGCCIYSVEQLVMLKKNAERNGLFHHMNGL